MDTFVAGGAAIIAAAAVAAIIAVVVRRHAATDSTRDTALLGAVLTIVTGLHSVLVVFVLVGVIETAWATRQATTREADSLIAAVWATDTLDPGAQADIRDQARRYADLVVQEEWPRLRAGEPVGQTGWLALQQLRRTILDAPAAAELQQERRAEASENVVDTYLARQTRLTVGTTGVAPLIWFMLVVGAASSLTLPYLFSGKRTASFPMLVAVMAAVTTMLLFTIFHLQNPFTDGGGVSDDPYRSAIERLAQDS